MSRGTRTRNVKLEVENMVNNRPCFVLECHPWSTISELKQMLQKELREQGVQPSQLQIFYKNLELSEDRKTVLALDIKSRGKVTVRLNSRLENSQGCVHAYKIFDHPPEGISLIIDSIRTGLSKGIKPKLADRGTSGSYFLQTQAQKIVAIFKPFDEEPFAPNNPRKYVGELGSQGFRKGILSGESATREVAAYMLDRAGFHGVPETSYVEFYHPTFQERHLSETVPVKRSPTIKGRVCKLKTKHGSLQRFVQHDDTIGNFGANCFSVEQIHKIAILDIRILNCDRNDQNILVNKSEKVVDTAQGLRSKKDYKAIPIDHGLSFPDSLEIYDYEIMWINFPQCMQPFTKKELDFINQIDPAADCQYLKQRLDFRSICLRNFRIAQILLKEAALLGFTIYEISQIMYRTEPSSESEEEETNPDKNFSELEKLVREAENIYSIVKKSGLKSTIQYQIGLVKPLNLQLVRKSRSYLKQIKQNQKQDEQQSQETQQEYTTRQMVSLEKNQKRTVSLPCMKAACIDNRGQGSKQPKKQKGKVDRTVRKYNRKREQDEQKWQQIFFYYFSQMLKRLLKSKKQNTVKRGRYLSENLG